MKQIVGVRFRKTGKIYYFNPKDLKLEKGTNVIVDTALGKEYGEVVIPNKEVEDSKVNEPLKEVIRVATKKDRKMYEVNKAKEPEAYKTFVEKAKEHNLKMKLVEVEYKYDGSKVIFYFTADGRIDFRDLVKDLASIFKTRIELRQIGVRDEVRRMGGCGPCGRELCCRQFLNNFESVSIKMAKDQNMSLNPSKISGNCGRLMCCLKYEECVYEEKAKKLPKVGAIVETQDGTGEVSNVEILKESVRVRYKDSEDNVFYKNHPAEEVTVIKDVKSNDKITRDDVESEEDLEELEELENLDKTEVKDEDDF